ncbi:hypothetical protein ACTS94_02685 [Empedobacter falsenii]
MENSKKIAFILLYVIFIISCSNNNSKKTDDKRMFATEQYIQIKDILYKDNNGNYYFKYPYPSRNGDKIETSYGYEDKILNINDSAINDLRNVLDVNKFHKLEYPYYSDNKYIYVVNNYAGSPNYSFYPMDYKSINIKGSYISDKENVYYFTKRISNVNSKNFNSKIFYIDELPIEIGYDNSSIFIQDEKLTFSKFNVLTLDKVIKDSLQKIYFPNK